jgi:outer membrane protein insertion porin family
VQYGQYAKGFELGFVEPYLMGYRIAFGIDLFAKQREASSYQSYDTESIGGAVRLGFSLREDLSLQLRYSLYSQKISLPAVYNNCSLSNPAPGCYNDGEASLPVRLELAQGAVITSLAGYTLAYNTLDNNKNPTRGILAEVKQDFAGLGGDVNFIRTTGDARFYTELIPDIIGLFRFQGGHIQGWGGKDVRMLDHFKMGPNLVRGFASAGFGPRDMTANTSQDALGGTLYWGASAELQIPLYFIPKDVGMRGAIFADAGSLWNYKGPVSSPSTGETILLSDNNSIRASVGAGIVWDSPFGPMRFDYAIPLRKEGYDRVQEFRFGGGTRF